MESSNQRQYQQAYTIPITSWRWSLNSCCTYHQVQSWQQVFF
jgi:hypothetical protein